jgi:hypothetical protein
MLKVSFITLVLASIGYKEYNPSVVGNWEDRKIKSKHVYFDGNGLFVTSQYDTAKYSKPTINIDSAHYTINRGTVKLDFIMDL